MGVHFALKLNVAVINQSLTGSVRDKRVWMLESSWEVWGRALLRKETQQNKINKMSKTPPQVTALRSLVCRPRPITVR